MTASAREPWKVSLHGGHSGEFCDHADGTLREILQAAAAFGYHTFGVSEHAPRAEERFLYPEELALGWDLAKVADNFRRYAREVRALAQEFSDRLTVLCGFEIEVVPNGRYAELMRALRERHGFDYMVGSVHYVDEILVDAHPETFAQAVDACGGLEGLAVRYYEAVAEMVETMRPEVVAHLDLIRKNAPRDAALDTPAIRKAADEALEIVRARGGILDVNTAGYRKGLGSPYPAPWLVQRANEIGIGFCFGDDSHRAADVGAGICEARQYLLQNGVRELTVLTREDDALLRRTVPLE
jgi:histidinol-phosphatase (PHP family)